MILRQVGTHLRSTCEILTSIIQTNTQLSLVSSCSDWAPKGGANHPRKCSHTSVEESPLSQWEELITVSLMVLTEVPEVTRGRVYIHRVRVKCNSK
jgi:hypothetical protein